MGKKLIVIALATLGFGFALAPRSNAGTEMIIDNSAQAPAPTYNYAPPPPPVRVYYAPPPPVVVYPAYGYSVPVRVYRVPRVSRRHFCPPVHNTWR